ncbi:hypothetical protein TrST_g4246 [Triparma strigata]|uniref:Uncharacterized protein n=1 Tax=Triparma strigata TaxID=1606541 RepID=A0A9W7BRZ0_9STRA|nr:hypothetical protein TrST_g4246 [Triparma strigata]
MSLSDAEKSSCRLMPSKSSKGSKSKGLKSRVEMSIVMDGCEEMEGLGLTVYNEMPTWEEVEVKTDPTGSSTISFPVSSIIQIPSSFLVSTSLGPCYVDPSSLPSPYIPPTTVDSGDYFKWWISNPLNKLMTGPQPTQMQNNITTEFSYVPSSELSPSCFSENESSTKKKLIIASATAPAILAGVVGLLYCKKYRYKKFREEETDSDEITEEVESNTIRPGVTSVSIDTGDVFSTKREKVEVNLSDNVRLQKKQMALESLKERHMKAKALKSSLISENPSTPLCSRHPSSSSFKPPSSTTYTSPMSPTSTGGIIGGGADMGTIGYDTGGEIKEKFSDVSL